MKGESPLISGPNRILHQMVWNLSSSSGDSSRASRMVEMMSNQIWFFRGKTAWMTGIMSKTFSPKGVKTFLSKHPIFADSGLEIEAPFAIGPFSAIQSCFGPDVSTQTYSSLPSEVDWFEAREEASTNCSSQVSEHNGFDVMFDIGGVAHTPL